ncbi:MAG: hypothetical protein ACK50P_00190, partial [Planctomycetaceae bacterium]
MDGTRLLGSNPVRVRAVVRSVSFVQKRKTEHARIQSAPMTENPVKESVPRPFLIGVLPGEGIGPE